jgi:protein O-mannosyl-transferase
MRRAVVIVLLTAVVAAIYAQAANFDFINLDDKAYVSENPNVLSGLSREGCVWAFTTTSQANWHPLTWLSLQLDAQLGGSSPRVYHTTNIVLHLANALLLFLLFERMTASVWRSALVAALFAVHPLHVESVAWVAERKDVLCVLFGLAACHAWLSSLRRPGVAWRALAVSAYAASLLAKPMLVSLPLLLLLLDVWPLRRDVSWQRLVLEKTPFIVLAGASCVVTVMAQAHGGTTRDLTQYPLDARAANAAVAYVVYLARAIWPAGLAVYYPYPYEGVPAWEAAGALLALAAATVACVRVRARAPYLLVGWLWYLVTLVPVIGLVQVGSQAMADRYTYVPLIGPFVMAAFALPRAAIAAVVWVSILAACAWRQTGYWSDSVSLFTRAISVTKDNAVAEDCLSRAYFDLGRIDLAVPHCEEAVRIAPGLGDAQSNLVRGLLAQGKTAEASERARMGLRDRPDDSRSHVNAGVIDRMEGRDDDAIRQFQEALRLDADDQEARLNLGAILAAKGRRDDAVAQFEEAVRRRPGDVRAGRALAQILGARP